MTKKPHKFQGRATVSSIAKQAGVSVAAVSSVLTNRHVERRISPRTVERIRKLARRMGYLPNINARRLRNGTAEGRNIIVAFVTSFEAPLSLANDLIVELRKAMIDSAGAGANLSFSLMVELFRAGELHKMPGLLSGDHFNAAIITNTTPEDDQFLSRTQLPFPVVLINRTIARYWSVIEDPQMGAEAASLLWAARRRKLAVLHGSPLTQTTRSRVDSFMRTVYGKMGRMPAEIVADQLTVAAACEAMLDFLKGGGSVDGLYAITDGMALGAYHAIKQTGRSVPGDVAVVGVGDYDISPFFDPPLTAVGVRRSEIGREASRLLLQQFEQPDLTPSQVVLPIETFARASIRRK